MPRNLKYDNSGNFLLDVPARDISSQEADELKLDHDALIASGLYSFEDEPEAEEPKEVVEVEEAQALPELVLPEPEPEPEPAKEAEVLAEPPVEEVQAHNEPEPDAESKQESVPELVHIEHIEDYGDEENLFPSSNTNHF